MPRFFMAGSNICGSSISITGADADHIKVLRMRAGDSLAVRAEHRADERRHLSALEMEHFMLTGDSAAAPKSTYPKTESGFLSALRAAALAEAESAAEHEKAAQERGGELGAVCAAISKDDAEHARVLRGMIARCFRLREE